MSSSYSNNNNQESLSSLFETLYDEMTSSDFASQMQSTYAAMNGLYNQFTTLVKGVDIFYSLICGSMVLFMQCGFIMICIGSMLPSSPSLNKFKDVLLKYIVASFSAMIGFWSIGFGLAYQRGIFLGTSGERFFLQDYKDYIDFFFQSTFALTVSSIVVGTVISTTSSTTSTTFTGRGCKTIGCVLYSFFLTAFVYPVIAHTIWNDDGFLSAFSDDPRGGVGMIDFAGSGVVHVTSGATALVAAVIFRRCSRTRSNTTTSTTTGINRSDVGRNDTESSSSSSTESFSYLPHCSILLQVLGTFALWIGWYGFNAGSTLSISPPGYGDAAALSAVTTTLSATCGGITCMCFDALVGFRGNHSSTTGRKQHVVWNHENHEHGGCDEQRHDDRDGHDGDYAPFVEYDISMALKGCLSGLVSITACCSIVEPWAACLIGCLSGILYILSSNLIVMKCFRIYNDCMGTISIHLFNGIWGCIATGIFASPRYVANAFGFNAHYSGLLYVGSSNGTLIVNELLGIVFILAWTIGTMTVCFLLLNQMGLLLLEENVASIGGVSSSSFGEDGEGETEMLTKHMDKDPEKEHSGIHEDDKQDDTFMDDQGKIV